jgi:pyruvate dehydrogenase E2 component (dihydrolipoamide acetyltransferase)
MPSLGADMESGVMVQWLIGPGDVVARGDPIAWVETDKGAIEIEAFDDGVVEALLEPVGARVAVGRPIARLAGDAPGTPPSPPRATPGARRAAAARGVDLDTVTGTGPGGTVTEADVAGAGGAPAGRPPAPSDAAAALRRVTGELMARAKREIPHYYLEHRMDASRVIAHLAALNADRAPADRAVLTPFLIRAIVKAAAEVPEVNGHFRDGVFAPADTVDVGLAIALRGGGVVAPVVRGADRLRADELVSVVRDLVGRVRTGAVRSSEVGDGTITLSSLGERSVEVVHGVIHPPQVALVGAGSVVPRPWAVGDDVQVRPVLALTLSGDHRASDGRRGGRFHLAVQRQLDRPEEQ